MKLLAFILFLPFVYYGQATIRGVALSAENGQGIAFASIGLVGKTAGSIADEHGNFELKELRLQPNDSLQISAIGYKAQTVALADAIKEPFLRISLESLPMQLEEVVVSSKKIKYHNLGAGKYTKNNCGGFVKNAPNWKGTETAILTGNKEGRKVLVENFSFYVIQNKYSDSLTFRLMFYEAGEKKFPRHRTFLRKPVVFKVGLKQGEFSISLREYNIVTAHDFFVSLECLEAEMDISKFCYASSYDTPAFVKGGPFERWNRVKGGGADFKVKVSVF